MSHTPVPRMHDEQTTVCSVCSAVLISVPPGTPGASRREDNPYITPGMRERARQRYGARADTPDTEPRYAHPLGSPPAPRPGRM